MKLSNQSYFVFAILISSFFFLSGCASVTTSVGFHEEDNEYFSDVLVDTKAATQTDAEIVEVEIIEEEKAEEVVDSRPTHKSSKGYWRAAIQYLQTGNEDDARWALENALFIDPKNKIAKELMYQLDVDAINALGAENFEYKVQFGDSLSKLSKLFLNDALKFYLLSKYNDISDPSRLVVGQVIQIPGTKEPFEVLLATKGEMNSAVSVVDSNNSEDNNNTVASQPQFNFLNDAREMLAAGETMAVIELLENSSEDIQSNADLVSMLVNAYYLEAKKLNGTKNYIESKLLLTRAIELEPDNTEVNMMLIDMNELDQADIMYKKSLKAIAANDPVNAYKLINQALVIQPGHKLAVDQKVQIKKSLTEYYYKQALMAQRKHELDAAVGYWDEVLLLDNNNENAKLYRAKAVSLKVKLEKFVSN